MVINQPWTFMSEETYPFWAQLEAFDGRLLRDFEHADH